MIILTHSDFHPETVADNLGEAEYSYWFVRKAFHRILNKFGVVIPIRAPQVDVNQIVDSAAAHSTPCLFVSFNPPHKTALGVRCPILPVFAWEYDTIPTEVWQNEPRNDWAAVFKAVRLAVTHSEFSAAAVRRQMGSEFPIWSIPAPVYDTAVHHARSARGWHDTTKLTISETVIDAGLVDLDRFSPTRARQDGIKALQALQQFRAVPNRQPTELTLSGVIYTAIFNPYDLRKNWNDIVGAFIWAFREVPDATLILKIVHYSLVEGAIALLSDLAKHGEFKCRIILIHGMLPDEEYSTLIQATSYAVNASHAEGQCLPLMEFMSAGRPAVAPRHTAMLDYLTPDNAFIVRSFEKPAAWPQDTRQALRCKRNAVSFADLVRAYRDSYRVAREQPRHYETMSTAAVSSLEKHCSDSVVTNRLETALQCCLSRSAVVQPAKSDRSLFRPDMEAVRELDVA
jgi:glycosyltransferase involved in cell wall biosynthesis